MEALVIILLIVILIVVINSNNSIKSKMLELDHKINTLIRQQESLNRPPQEASSTTPQRWNRQPDRPELFHYTPPQIVDTPAPPSVPPPPPPPVTPPVTATPVEADPVEETTISSVPAPVETAPVEEHRTAAFTPVQPAEPSPSFWEKNPDLEKFIGENLFNKIGIAILVIGIGFFLKYAIDKDWINETGRTFIGILCGGILIGIAHRLRKTFNAFSSVLVGGGVAILYFSITIAFQQYHLISQTLAFIMMILITAFTIVLSLSYDRKELAVLAILGGFSSPLLVSTGAGNAAVLFTYILILNVGMLILAYYKKWNVVNIISYAATVILFGSWLSMSITNETSRPVPYVTALIFATLFYIVFFGMNVINNLRQRVNFNAGEILILLSNTFLYYAAGMVILAHLKAGLFQGLFTACIAGFNFIFAYSLYRNRHADKNLIYLLIGLTLSFLSLAAPVQLEGNHITLFWAAESVLLLWLFQRSQIKLLGYAATVVFALMFISLMMDWAQIYGVGSIDNIGHMWPLLNKGFITGAVSIAASAIIRQLLKKETDRIVLGEIRVSGIRFGLEIFLLLLVYIVGILELSYQSGYYWPAIIAITTGIYNYLFACYILYSSRKEAFPLRIGSLFLAGIAVLVYVYYNDVIINIRTAYLAHSVPLGYLLLSFVLTATALITLYQTYLTIKTSEKKEGIHIFQWSATIAMLFILSATLDHIVALSLYQPGIGKDKLLNTSQRTGYTILWGAFAFVLIYLGFRWQSRQVRIISISLFAVTLLKLFVFDLRNLSEGGKIAAFISLGILLLVISFMYQRLKKLLLTDEQPKNS